jgi:serine/threonine protein kinase
LRHPGANLRQPAVDPFNHLCTALADRYTVQREVGRGGMAIVFLAHDLRHNRDVAIKVLKPEFAMAVSADRFLREIQIEAQLRHPYILPLFDSGDAEGLLYYVMPHVAGRSLQARLTEEIQLPLEEALRITSEVAEALAHAHARGVVHRDVKPGNILLDEGHALMADFGIARAVSDLAGPALSDSGIVVGTPEYMSPEQCSNKGKVDGRSDIYALGCVLYQMLSGEPPFTGATAQAIIARHLQDRPRSLRVVRPAIPQYIEEAIGVALAKAPAARFGTALRFVAALKPGERPLAPYAESG